jgi:hypothetical protein
MDIRAIDVGCGAGEMSRILVEHLGIGHILCIDTVQSNVHVARKYLQGGREASRYCVECTSIENLNGATGGYHLAIALGSLEHNQLGIGPGLRAIGRGLDSGGMLVVTVPWQNWYHTLANYVNCRSGSRDWEFYQYRLTRSELRRELRMAGFGVRVVKPIHWVVGARRRIDTVIPHWVSPYVRKAMAIVLAAIVPAPLVAHMICAIARKEG